VTFRSNAHIKLSELPSADIADSNVSLLATGSGVSKKVEMTTLAEMLWSQMYIHAKAVIVQCPYCNSHNAVTNPTCVQCGVGLGGTL